MTFDLHYLEWFEFLNFVCISFNCWLFFLLELAKELIGLAIQKDINLLLWMFANNNSTMEISVLLLLIKAKRIIIIEILFVY